MTDKEFKKAMHAIGNGEAGGEYYEYAMKRQKMRRTVKTGVICALAVAAVAGITAIAVSLSRNGADNNGNPERDPAVVVNYTSEPAGNGSADQDPAGSEKKTAEAVYTEVPDEIPATEQPTDEPTPPPTEAPTPEPVYVPVDLPQPEPASSEWFEEGKLEVEPVYYAAANSDINSFATGNSCIDLILTTVSGEHEDCYPVYYDPDTDEVFCYYHAFLKASGLTPEPGEQLIFFNHDKVLKNISVVEVAEAKSVQNQSIWIFDRDAGTAGVIALPEGCSRYEDLYIYGNAVWNGKICISVNSSEIGHFIYFYDIRTGSCEKVLERDDGGWISGRFLSENIIELTEDGYRFYNVSTGVLADVIGEYNYFCNGKVFSVRNNGWASRKDVRVAAYDAATGQKLENETVLVQTVLENGQRAFLTKNTTTGEENVVLCDYANGCYTWSGDGRFFYAYSASNKKMMCFSAENGTAFCTDVDELEEQVSIDGVDYIVFKNYGIAVSDNNSLVRLYYTRVLMQKDVIPEYEDEKVDSPCWRKYCELKAKNFEDRTYFCYSVKENLPSFYLNVSDMVLFRDLLLKCLENAVLVPGKTMTSDNHLNGELGLMCGILRMYFFYENGRCYLSLDYNAPIPEGAKNEVYEFPEDVFNEINAFFYDYTLSGNWH